MGLKVLLYAMCGVLLGVSANAATLAFPGAEGGGMYTSGGRGGRVIYVDRLDDDGSPGTLRWAVKQKGPRTVLFKVSGIIDLRSKLVITNGDLTIAGQSAPGDGICVKGYTVQVKDASNVIIRFMRFRLGDEHGAEVQDDALGAQWCTDMIVDHCSMSWSTDECGSFYGNSRFTLQWSILSESLRKSVHEKGEHGYGGIWGGRDATFHHNLLAHHDSRNPRIDHECLYGTHPLEVYRGNVDLRNNVIYNWGANSTYGGEGGFFNIVGNYYKKGPASSDRRYFLDAYGICEFSNGKREWHDVGYPVVYMSGNFYEGDPGGINGDNRAGIKFNQQRGEASRRDSLIAELPILGRTGLVSTHTAQDAFKRVLAYAGASDRRDPVDARAVADTRSGKATFNEGGKGSTGGLIDTPSAVGGWPVYNSLAAPADSDGDGMPDAWERRRGLNPADPSDGAAAQPGKGGYTNLEIYLNSLVARLIAAQGK